MRGSHPRVFAKLKWLRGILVVAAAGVSCHPRSESSISVAVGNSPARRASFVPETALVEYFELAGARSELGLTLASYDVRCGEFSPPPSGGVFVSVRIVSPESLPIGPGVYPWGGREAHGGTANHPDRPFAMPKVLIGSQSHLFPPGGAVQLGQVSLERDGLVAGTLAFEFAGDAKAEATNLRGSFSAKVCKVSRPPGKP